MVDREKVIHGLNSCGNDDGHPDRCGRTECPYRDNGAWCTHELAHDAEMLVSELLKAQEPRVMTLAELEHTEVAYAEDNDKADIIPVLVKGRRFDRFAMVKGHLGDGTSHVFHPSIYDYGKRWRCWTSRPDEKRRAETPWEQKTD